MSSLPTIKPVEPKRFISRDGYEVEFDNSHWRLSKDVNIRVASVGEILANPMYESYREVLTFYAKGNSPHYVDHLHDVSLRYFRAIKGQTLFGVESLISYRALLGPSGENQLATLRTFIKKWANLGYDGISVDALRLLKKWTLSGGERGNPIRSMCPEKGPLSDIEMEGVVTAAIDAYENGRLTLFEISITMALMMTGRRPIQITALKIGDLFSRSQQYFLNVPRAKQQLEGGWRKTFKQIPLVEDLWLLLQRQADSVHREFAALTGVSAEQRRGLPLFPNYPAFDESQDLSLQLATDQLHLPVADLNQVMFRVAGTIGVISERTGEPIRIHPYRFRYTFGTNLGREGKGEYVIAEALDHTDTQHTGVYVKNLPENAERIDKAVALELAPIAQAFQGILVKAEREARRGDDPSSRISNGTENLGSCGNYGLCGALAPVACYTCVHFQPWLDGPHEAVLDHLIQERDRILEHTGDLKIASVNDRLILAVGDVVVRCGKMKEERTDGRHPSIHADART